MYNNGFELSHRGRDFIEAVNVIRKQYWNISNKLFYPIDSKEGVTSKSQIKYYIRYLPLVMARGAPIRVEKVNISITEGTVTWVQGDSKSETV